MRRIETSKMGKKFYLWFLSAIVLQFLYSTVSALSCPSEDLPEVQHGSFVCDGLANICTLKCKYGYYPSSATEINCLRNQQLTERDAWRRVFTCTECSQSSTFSVTWGYNDYLFVKMDHTWDNAHKMCQAKDMSAHLAFIESEEENDFIHTILYQCVNQSHVWIGLNDRSIEGNWQWMSTSATYFNWAEAGPYFHEPDGGRDENCVVMSRSTGKWHDVACEWPRFAICERDLYSRRIPVD